MLQTAMYGIGDYAGKEDDAPSSFGLVHCIEYRCVVLTLMLSFILGVTGSSWLPLLESTLQQVRMLAYGANVQRLNDTILPSMVHQ